MHRVQATPQCVGFAIAASVDLVSSRGQGSKTIFAKKRAISELLAASMLIARSLTQRMVTASCRWPMG